MTLAPHVLAVDPGRDKCGIARVSLTGVTLWRKIVPRPQLERALSEIAAQPPEVVVIGSGTTSKAAVSLLKKIFGVGLVKIVDETNSTLEARALYFMDHPPRGFWAIIPRSMQTPGVPIDDYAAVVLARRYLARTSKP